MLANMVSIHKSMHEGMLANMVSIHKNNLCSLCLSVSVSVARARALSLSLSFSLSLSLAHTQHTHTHTHTHELKHFRCKWRVYQTSGYLTSIQSGPASLQALTGVKLLYLNTGCCFCSLLRFRAELPPWRHGIRWQSVCALRKKQRSRFKWGSLVRNDSSRGACLEKFAFCR